MPSSILSIFTSLFLFLSVLPFVAGQLTGTASSSEIIYADTTVVVTVYKYRINSYISANTTLSFSGGFYPVTNAPVALNSTLTFTSTMRLSTSSTRSAIAPSTTASQAQSGVIVSSATSSMASMTLLPPVESTTAAPTTMVTSRSSTAASSRSSSSSSSSSRSGTSSSSLSSSSITSSTRPGATIKVSYAGVPYEDAMLQTHNIHRANHTNTRALTWDPALVATAQQIAQSCVYQHNQTVKNPNGSYGQNIGAGAPPGVAPALITNLMYNNELPRYPGPFDNNNVPLNQFEAWGHFSQIVWAKTQRVGCFTQYCPGGLARTGPTIRPYFTVCNYQPAGNFAGQWAQVHAPLGGPTIQIV